jgi:hypothetical protein
MIEKTVGAWESFEEGENHPCDIGIPDVSKNWKATLVGTIRKQMSELKALHKTLLEKAEMFDNMQNRVKDLEKPGLLSNFLILGSLRMRLI